MISTRVENREKWADLISGSGERWETEKQQLTLANLREEFEKWVRNHHCSIAQDHCLKLLDPFTGTEIQRNEADIKFGLDFNPIKIKEPQEGCFQKTQQSSFSDRIDQSFEKNQSTALEEKAEANENVQI